MRYTRILLIEDDPNDQELVRRTLDKHHVANEIVVAEDGRQALDYLMGTGSYAGRDVTMQPQLVILDLVLPRVDGIEVLLQLRARDDTRQLPVVILTASDDQDKLARTHTSECTIHLRKPLEFDAFARAVGSLGLCWVLLRR